MPPRERDPDQNQRRPRAFRHPEGSDGEDLVDDDEDVDDDDEDDDDDDSDDEDVPPDPAHEARMAIYRAENARLVAELAEQDRALAEMQEETRLIQEAAARRREELNQLRAMRAQREREAQREHEAQMAAGTSGDQSKQVDDKGAEQKVERTGFSCKNEDSDPKGRKDSDTDGDSPASASQSSN